MKKLNIVLFLLSACIITVSAQEKVKILSYNVLFGLQKDSTQNVERYKTFVKSLDPDIVATQEMNGWKQKTLEELGKSYGHAYALQSKEEGFPVALTSKTPMVNFKKVTENMWHSYIYAKVKGLHLFVIHFSPFSYVKRLEEVENILAQVKEIPSEEPILIMGDFNSLVETDATAYDKKVVEAMKNQEQQQAHIRNLNHGKIDYSVLGKLAEAGFKDSYRLMHSEFTGTVPTRKDGKGNWKKDNQGTQKRIDFLWCNETASKLVTKSEIIKNELTDVISDHYPVYVELTLNK
jgi:exodeoxyribonuclease-3